MQTKNADVNLGLLDYQNLIALLLNQADGEDGVIDILQDDTDDMEYDVHATFEYTWEDDPKTTLPSYRRLVSVSITSHRDNPQRPVQTTGHNRPEELLAGVLPQGSGLKS